ncbi:MAG: hypothetical protein M3P38_05170 [Chloroflexota bacterium]|nr:hypothetical protein [Chloroflexota bacterium]
MIETITRLAAPSTFLAVPMVLLAAITLVLFFRGRGDRFGTLNDLFSAIALLLLIPPVVAVYRVGGDDAGTWLLALTIATVAGLLVAAIGQLLLILRAIDLSASFVTGGVGVLPVLIWVAALAWLSLGRHLFPEALGWLGLTLLASAILVAVFSTLKIDAATTAFSFVLVAALLGWLVALGMAFATPPPGLL